MKKPFISTKIWVFLECLLFIIVISGLYTNKVINKGTNGVKNNSWATSQKLTGWNDDRLKREAHESDLEYATRMNEVIGTSFYHCKWYTKENIFEVMASYFSKTWDGVGFLQAGRNCGFCHQAAYILSRVLNDNSVDAYPLGINGHVVVKMKSNDMEYIFDPDFAVGPMEYQDDMRHYIPEIYGTGKGFRNLYKPYTTSADDKPYRNMKLLNDAEKEQSKILRNIKFVYYGCIVLFICNSVLLIISIRKKRKACNQ